MSSRKVFILLLAFSAFCASSASAAEPQGRIPRIGVLSPGGTRFFLIDAFRQGLRELGYIEGENLTIDYRYADWKLGRLPGLAEELVRLRPDVILTHTTPGVLSARQATRTIPIVVESA